MSYRGVKNKEQLDDLITEVLVNMAFDGADELHDAWFSKAVQDYVARHNPGADTLASAFTWSLFPRPESDYDWMYFNSKLYTYAEKKWGLMRARSIKYRKEGLVYSFYPINGLGDRVSISSGAEALLAPVLDRLLPLFKSHVPSALLSIKEEDDGKSYWEVDLSNMDNISGVSCESCDALVNNHIELAQHQCAPTEIKKYEL